MAEDRDWSIMELWQLKWLSEPISTAIVRAFQIDCCREPNDPLTAFIGAGFANYTLERRA
jgi:hypothetical protein